MASVQQGTALDPLAVDLDQGQSLPRQLLDSGFHKFFLTDYKFVEKNPGEDGWKRYVELELQHEATGWKRRAYVNWPIPGDELIVIFTDKDGKEYSKAGSKIASLRSVIAALGGPETGPITPDTFSQLVGNAALMNVSHEEYQGEWRDRVDLQFGKGIKPCA